MGNPQVRRMIIAGIQVLVLLLAFPCAQSATREERPAYTIRDEHPRIFMTNETLGDIGERCADKRGEQGAYYGALKDFADQFIPGKKKPWVSHCLCLAFVYAVGEVPGYRYSKRSVEEYGRLGVDMLLQLHPPKDLSYFRRKTPLLIACYDWLFPAMTPEERASVFENFTSVCDKMRDSARKEIGNRFRGTRETYAYYGLAFHGDGEDIYPNDPSLAEAADHKTREYCEFFVSYFRDNYFVVLETACKGGNNPDGTMYGEHPYSGRIWPLDMWDTASTENLYENHTFSTGFPLAWLYQAIPYRTAVRYDNANGRIDQPWALVRFGDYRYIGYTNALGPKINIAQAQGVATKSGHLDLAAVFSWFIQQGKDTQVAAFGGPFSHKRTLEAGPHLVWDIIFRDGTVRARSPDETKLPLAHLFGAVASGPSMAPDFPEGRPEGTGIVVMRSAWEDPDGALVWFKASSHMLSHSHRDQGSFQIYKKGWLAIDSGQYEETSHRGNYAVRTVAHNSILVYSPGEALDRNKVDPVWYGYANDGGQRWVPYVTTAAAAKDAKHYLGGVTEFESVPGVYDYVHADITRAYNCPEVTTEGHKPKVSLVTRTLVFLRPDEFIVVFDRVHSTKAEYPKRWLLHSIYRPELDGQETFDGIIPYSRKIPGKPEGVPLQGNLRGGISQSLDTSMITLKGWNLGPSGGRLVCRTLLPERHVTRVVGGADPRAGRKTKLARPYKGEKEVVVEDSEGFEPGDFVYLGESEWPYSKTTSGKPCWPVEDVFYKGYGNILRANPTTNTITMKPYRAVIPQLPEGTPVIRSDHANAQAFEFLDAEYNQWPMEGEGVANAGPFHMQHGSWRVEVEPVKQSKEDVFLHVMVPCEVETLAAGHASLRKDVHLLKKDDAVILDITGKTRRFRLTFESDSPAARLVVEELSSGRTILDNSLTRSGIAARTAGR
jgi:hypothetical protein